MPASVHQYLPRLVREWDHRAPGRLHQSIDGSMVFVDVSGFTKMSERLARHGKVGAEEVTEVIGGTFELLLTKAYEYGASLLKFGGDALLLFFEGDAHHLRACAAAVGMRQRLRDVGRFETTAGQVTLRMSVGVHAGSFDFFMVGESHRELIVAGPAATATTVMEAVAKAGQIVVSPAIAERLPKQNVGRPLDPGFLLAGHVRATHHEVEAAPAKSDLGQFVATAMRDSLLSGEVEPEHRPVAIGFVHFLDFDRLIETSGRAAAADALDRLVKVVQAAVDQRGVTFLASDIAGDGGKIILASGIPRATGNDEEQLLLALREIVASPVDVPLQIGVNWGPVFAGGIGLRHRRTYTVMGDTVNLAARLMTRAPAGHIIATAAVLGGSRTLFETRKLEPFYVKGKKLPITAFEVGDPIGSRDAVDVGIPLVGREPELATLGDAWDSAGRSEGRLVEIVAETGMGKTRLLQEFLLRLGDSRTVRAECRLYQAATPYFPFRALLRQALDLEGLDAEQTAAKLQVRVQEGAPAMAPWLALIGDVLNIEIPPSPEVEQLEDQFRPIRTVAVIGTLLETVVTNRTLFVIEDTHWMDDASRELLAGLLVGLDRQPWMFILTRRPAEQGFKAPVSEQLERVELKALTQEQAEALINSATNDQPLLAAQVAALASRAAGNPLFLVELLRTLHSDSDVDSLPPSVEGLIAARIDRLAPGDRHMLRRLAVLGNGFRAEHAGAVIPHIEPAGRVRIFGRLGDFITLNHTSWVQFRHALIRDVAYESLPFKTRAELHRSVGDSIRLMAGDEPNGQAELLSLHYFYAHNWVDAWQFSRVAGDNAKAIYANLEAATFYRRALTAAARIDLLGAHEVSDLAESLGDVLELGGMFEESVDAFKRAARLSEEPVRRADLMLKRARARLQLSAFRSAMRDLGEGLRIITGDGSQAAHKARARLVSFSAYVRLTQQSPRAAIALAEEAMAEALAAGEEEALARSYSVLDSAYNLLGQPDKATYGRLALDIYEEIGDQAAVAAVTNNLGARAYFEGRWTEALGYYLQARDAFDQAGDEAEAASAAANIGEVFVSQGRYAEAKPLLREAARVLRVHKVMDMALFAEIQEARLGLATGNLEAALDRLSALRNEAAELGFANWSLEATLYSAIGLIRGGHLSLALEAVDNIGQVGLEVYASMRSRVRAEALSGLGRTEEALAEIEAGLSLADQHGLPYEKALLLLLKADLTPAAIGARDHALEEGRGLLQRLGVIRSD